MPEAVAGVVEIAEEVAKMVEGAGLSGRFVTLGSKYHITNPVAYPSPDQGKGIYWLGKEELWTFRDVLG